MGQNYKYVSVMDFRESSLIIVTFTKRSTSHGTQMNSWLRSKRMEMPELQHTQQGRREDLRELRRAAA